MLSSAGVSATSRFSSIRYISELISIYLTSSSSIVVGADPNYDIFSLVYAIWISWWAIRSAIALRWLHITLPALFDDKVENLHDTGSKVFFVLGYRWFIRFFFLIIMSRELIPVIECRRVHVVFLILCVSCDVTTRINDVLWSRYLKVDWLKSKRWNTTIRAKRAYLSFFGMYQNLINERKYSINTWMQYESRTLHSAREQSGPDVCARVLG